MVALTMDDSMTTVDLQGLLTKQNQNMKNKEKQEKIGMRKKNETTPKQNKERYALDRADGEHPWGWGRRCGLAAAAPRLRADGGRCGRGGFRPLPSHSPSRQHYGKWHLPRVDMPS